MGRCQAVFYVDINIAQRLVSVYDHSLGSNRAFVLPFTLRVGAHVDHRHDGSFALKQDATADGSCRCRINVGLGEAGGNLRGRLRGTATGRQQKQWRYPNKAFQVLFWHMDPKRSR